MHMDEVLTSGTHGRRILKLDECNLDYSAVKTNANKTTAVVFISCWVLSKSGGSATINLGSKPKKQLDLRIKESMQICIHWKDNSPNPVNHHLTSKEGPKIKSDNIRRFPAHDILQVGFTLQTSTINNKRVIRTFKFGCTRLTLKEGLKIKSDHIRRFPVHDFL